MGVDYRAVIVVGLRRKDITDISRFYDEDENLNFSLFDCSTYYDGEGKPHNVIGVEVWGTNDYNNTEIDFGALDREIDDAKVRFKNLTGQEAMIYLSTHGY